MPEDRGRTHRPRWGLAGSGFDRGAYAFIASRLLGATLTLLTLVSAVFLVLRLVPGDPSTLILGDQASASAVAELKHRLRLDEPLIFQYAHFLWGILRFDLGMSLMYPGEAAMSVVSAAVWPTAKLAFVAVALGTIFGITAAELSVGPFVGRAKGAIYGVVLVVAAVPLLSFAPLVTWVFAVRWQWLPLPGDPDAGLSGLLFAGGLLSLPLGAQVARVARASLLDQKRGQFLVVARAKGASNARVWFIHALAVAAPPIAVVVAMQLGALLGGAVVLERLFERQGLGQLLLKAYFSRDLPVLEGCVVASGFLFILTQLATAVAQAALDPRRGAERQNA